MLSNTKRLKVDFETAEAMMNHLRSGMEWIYDGYELEEEKAGWLSKWEQEIVAIATRVDIPADLGVPAIDVQTNRSTFSLAFGLPRGAPAKWTARLNTNVSYGFKFGHE